MPNPDNPDWLVHFTGRAAAVRRFDETTLSGQQAARAYRAAAPEQRLHDIFASGGIKGFSTYGTADYPVVCFSELTREAIRVQMTTGFVLGRRPPWAPWALVMRKQQLIRDGVRPVLYMSSDELRHLGPDTPPSLWTRCVRSVPGSRSDDWSHEREWRLCTDTIPPATAAPFGLPLNGRVLAVIVGRPGWVPRDVHDSLDFSSGLDGIERWYFHDGQIRMNGYLFGAPVGQPGSS